MSGKKLVVVESPTKAKTIRKFLGKEFIVESCMGHVRDLPQSAKDIPEKFKKEKWANLGVNTEDDFAPVYCIPRTKTRIVKALKEKLQDADELILATDEDREGESISWHLIEVLKPKVPVKRMVFHEITKDAIQKALGNFREVDENLVKAQEARRILDRLVGYTLSPLLWKKVAYGLSAGRVQSVAVRLIAEREHERIRFKKVQYWGVSAKNEKDGIEFESRLHSIRDQKIAIGRDFDGETGQLLAEKASQLRHLMGDEAKEIIENLKGKAWVVDEVEEKPVSRKPAAPFITSTLQQEANRKLGLSSRETMDVAQKLYERGFITYMRTDSTNLSQQALDAARSTISMVYGKAYLPPEPRDYSAKKSKAAQEAHEAIRPAGVEFAKPEDTGLTGSLLKVYDLIWKRTIASQMVNAQQKQVSVKFRAGEALFSASGMTIEFPGFLKVYVEDTDEADSNDTKEFRLPQLKVGEKISCQKLTPTEHETKPTARYTEASLVQALEKEGIGRPSTYATIIGTIQDRGYVKKVGNALVPTFTALVVSKLLSKYLPNFVDLKFTSGMEDSLDSIAQGELDHIKYLGSIYFGKAGLKSQVDEQEKTINGEESRSIQIQGLPGLTFRIGRYGAYVCRQEKGLEEVCASLPDNQFPGDMTHEVANKLINQKVSGADALGKDPNSGLSVYVLSGRYGPYVQLGEAQDFDGKPKRMAIPATLEPESVSLNQALALLELPKSLGAHPETGKDIKKGLGRFGPYVVHDGDFRSIPKTDNIFEVDLKRALELLAQPKKIRGRSAPLKELGPHPQTGEDMQILTGKYGPYVRMGKFNVSLPDDVKPEDVTPEQAINLLADKISSGKLGPKAGGKPAKKKVAKAKEQDQSRQAPSTKSAESAATPKPKAKAQSQSAQAVAAAKSKVVLKKASANLSSKGPR